MKRMMSRKSHSWWWDSHISPKNSKWLAENLEAMDRLVKEMLKLVEEEGDSFAKKAEMYYKRRPELIAHVENFYRMYRALAERYDHVTGELRKNIPVGLQSQGSSGGSDLGSEPPSPSRSPSPEQETHHKFSRSQTRARAAGFDFFLGSGGSAGSRKGSESSSSSSDSGSNSDSDDVKDMSGDLDPVHVDPRMIQLERELQDMKEKLQQYQQIVDEEHALPSRVAQLEAELVAANQKLQGSREVINKLKQDLEKTAEVGHEFGGLEREQRTGDQELQAANETNPVAYEVSMNELKASVERYSQERLVLDAKMSEQAHAIKKLNEMLESSSGMFSVEKLNLEKHISSLSETNASLQEKLSLLEDERRQLVLSQTAEESSASTEKRIEELKQNLDTLKHKVDVLSSDKEDLSAKVLELTQDLKCKDDQIKQMDVHLHQLHLEHVKLITEAEEAQRASKEMEERVKGLEEEVERQQALITEGAEKKREAIRQLCFSLEHYQDGYRQLRRALQDQRRLTPVLAS